MRRAHRTLVVRRDGRCTRARMTLRGRVTLLALGALAGLGTWEALPSSSKHPSEVLAPVSAAAPAMVLPPPPSVPETILSRLPPTARGLAATDGAPERPLAERLEAPAVLAGVRTVEVEYTLDPALVKRVKRVLTRGRVALGHVIVLEPQSGRVLAYASTDPERFPATRAYSAASLIKVVTAAATLERAPEWAQRPCRYRGNPYRLTRSRLDPPRIGRTTSLRRALAMSNNQCFAQLAVHALGFEALRAEIDRFGLLESPGPGHPPGDIDPVQDPLDLGRLGSGLAGCRITPLGAARLAATLATGELVEPRWIERVVADDGRELALPRAPGGRAVLSDGLAERLRAMLVETTERGTARRAFRSRNGRPLLAPIRVAGKTGSLTGRDPDGRYEWFIGFAPAARPRVAVATLVVNGDLYWRNASQLAAEVLKAALCAEGPCRSGA